MRQTNKLLACWGFIVLLAALPLAAPERSPIVGQYRFVVDQPADISAAAGGEILLSVTERGELHISAKKPGEVLTTIGTYTLNGSLISIQFPELGKSVADGPWKIDGEFLILPLQFIGDGPGTSRWRRIQGGNGPVQRFFDVINREARKGTKPSDALRLAAEEARSLSLAAGGGDPALRVKRFNLWNADAGCTLLFEDGHYEALRVASASPAEPKAVPQGMSPLATDPRTHIPAQPHTAPDDPKSKSGILFAPFDITPFYAFAWGPPGPGQTAFAARTASYKEYGQNLSLLKETLEDRNYKVEILNDENATPLVLHNMILKYPPAPGLIYFSTHGSAETLDGVEITRLTSGVNLGLAVAENEIHKESGRVQEIIRRTVPPGYYGREIEVRGVDAPIIAEWAQQGEGFVEAHLSITNFFFERMRREGADFSTSFIYANACNTASNRGLVGSLEAKAFLGNQGEPDLSVVLAQAEWIILRLTKRTFSLREVLGLLHHIAKTRHRIFPHDDLLRIVSQEACETLVLFGQDGRYAQVPNFDTLYLCWLARWNAKNPEQGAQALQDTYDEYWQKMRFSRLKSPFANAGVRGSHVPTEEEVKFARHLVSGVPEKPGGRFTLNDADPGKNKARK